MKRLRIGPVAIRIGEVPRVARWCQGPRLRIGALSIWSRTNTGDHNIAAYHRADSITWRWIISMRTGKRFRGEDGRWKPRWAAIGGYASPGGSSGQRWLMFGSLEFTLHWQPHMRRDA